MAEQGAYEQVLAELQIQLEQYLARAREMKQMINKLSKMAGKAEPYPDADEEIVATALSIQPDTFYGQPLATAVRQYLDLRRTSNQGPATVSEIHAALISGGFQFDTKNDDNAKRGLRISLSKNPAFHKLPNGTYGLTDWYPDAKERRKSKKAVSSNGDQIDDDEEGGSDGDEGEGK